MTSIPSTSSHPHPRETSPSEERPSKRARINPLRERISPLFTLEEKKDLSLDIQSTSNFQVKIGEISISNSLPNSSTGLTAIIQTHIKPFFSLHPNATPFFIIENSTGEIFQIPMSTNPILCLPKDGTEFLKLATQDESLKLQISESRFHTNEQMETAPFLFSETSLILKNPTDLTVKTIDDERLILETAEKIFLELPKKAGQILILQKNDVPFLDLHSQKDSKLSIKNNSQDISCPLNTSPLFSLKKDIKDSFLKTTKGVILTISLQAEDFSTSQQNTLIQTPCTEQVLTLQEQQIISHYNPAIAPLETLAPQDSQSNFEMLLDTAGKLIEHEKETTSSVAYPIEDLPHESTLDSLQERDYNNPPETSRRKTIRPIRFRDSLPSDCGEDTVSHVFRGQTDNSSSEVSSFSSDSEDKLYDPQSQKKKKKKKKKKSGLPGSRRGNQQPLKHSQDLCQPNYEENISGNSQDIIHSSKKVTEKTVASLPPEKPKSRRKGATPRRLTQPTITQQTVETSADSTPPIVLHKFALDEKNSIFNLYLNDLKPYYERLNVNRITFKSTILRNVETGFPRENIKPFSLRSTILGYVAYCLKQNNIQDYDKNILKEIPYTQEFIKNFQEMKELIEIKPEMANEGFRILEPIKKLQDEKLEYVDNLPQQEMLLTLKKEGFYFNNKKYNEHFQNIQKKNPSNVFEALEALPYGASGVRHPIKNQSPYNFSIAG